MRWGWLVFVLACSSPSRAPVGGDAPAPDAPPPLDAFAGPFDDFPALPIGGLPVLTGGAASGGPCLVEPALGTLFPKNWLRPRFTWVPTDSENLFTLTLSTSNETNVLTVVTQETTWTMPAAMWTGLSAHINDQPISVQIRGATFDGTQITSGPELGANGAVTIAPVEAPGSILYYTPVPTPKLRGFHVGDESVVDIVTPPAGPCVGCHATTPDGAYVAYDYDTMMWPPVALASTDGLQTAPPFVTQEATDSISNFKGGLDWPQFSAQHDTPGHTILLGSSLREHGLFDSGFELVWTNLQSAGMVQGLDWDLVGRGGDTSNAVEPAFGHQSDRLVYVSATGDSPTDFTDGDLATVPFAGGSPIFVDGASSADFNEYYPSFSPDDRLLSFTRAPAGQSSYANPLAEIFVIPADGGDPTRLAANDPVQCGAAAVSPGVTNSWSKWSPSTGDASGRRIYWLAFSSTRNDPQIPQLFVTPVVDDGSATLKTYPAIYLWNQPPKDHNHAAEWNVAPQASR